MKEQLALEYEFKLARAKKEAEGKAAANRIVSASLTDKILKKKKLKLH